MKQKKKIYIKCLQKFRVYMKRKQKKLQIPNKDIYVYTYIDDSNTTINFLKNINQALKKKQLFVSPFLFQPQQTNATNRDLTEIETKQNK